MHILLGILKIIGLLLLAIILLLLLIFLTVVFVPLRYEISFSRYPAEKKPYHFRGQAGMHWLLKLVGIEVTVEGSSWGAALRVLHRSLKKFGPLYAAENASLRVPESNTEKAVTNAPEKTISGPDERPGEDGGWEQQERSRETEIPEKQRIPRQTGAPERQEHSREADVPEKQVQSPHHRGQASEESGKNGFRSKIGSAFHAAADWILDLPRRMADCIQIIIGAMQDGGDKLDELERRLTKLIKRAEPFISADAASWYGMVWHKCKYMLNHYRIRRAEGALTLGTGSPDTTAIAVGVLYRMLPADSKKMELTPDFYQGILEGEMTIKGHIRLNHAVWMGITLLLNKETRRMIRRIMRLRGGR